MKAEKQNNFAVGSKFLPKTPCVGTTFWHMIELPFQAERTSR
jgi:hypothetical protein